MMWRLLVPALLAPAMLATSSRSAEAQGPQVAAQTYEGWRQYSVHCARCHGQDVLGNPVAPDLRRSAGSGGPVESERAFTAVVLGGRTHRGMPAFKGQLSPEQAVAIYSYVHGRAADRIPPGRPQRPSSEG